MDESIALVAFSKHSERVRSKPFDYAHIEVGLKTWNPHRWHLGADVAHKSDAVKFTTVGGRIEAVVEDTSDDAARRASVGKRFKRFLGDGFAIGTVLAYDPNTKKFAASYGDGRADEQLSVADVHGGLIAQLPPLPPKKGKPPSQPIAVTLKVAGTKLWCLKDAKDLAKVLNAFNG